MRIYLVGPAGYPNYGDDFVVRSWLRFLTQCHSRAEIWLDCHSPGLASHLYREFHPQVRFTDFLWRISRECPVSSGLEVLKYGCDAWRTSAIATKRFACAQEALLGADVVHVAAAGLLNGLMPRHYALIAVVTSAPFPKAQTQRIITGGGLCPLEGNSLEMLAEVLRRFHVLDLRDEESRRALAKTGITKRVDVRMTGDDSFLDCPHGSERNTGYLSVNIQGDLWCGPGSGRLRRVWAQLSARLGRRRQVVRKRVAAVRRVVAAAAREWGSEYTRIRALELIPGVDRRFWRLAADALEVDEYRDFMTNFPQGLDIAPADIVITTRFHMHLLAARQGARGAWINVRPGYYDVKHCSAVTSGSNWPELVLNGRVFHPPRLVTPDPGRMRAMQQRKRELANGIHGAG